jgi:ABC-2 type transport system ATP-binding protein
MITCHQLTKAFGRHVALGHCDLEIAAGQITGLLGPNGAGKTTLIRTLLGFQRPTGGWAQVWGLDCVKQSLAIRQRVAYLPGEARLFRSMTGHGVLEIFSGLSPHGDLGRCRRVADRLELDLSRRVMFMSTGMRQKLALTVVLGSRAPLLILDEPTANLDPNVRAEVINQVREAHRDGRSVLLSSHIFSDVDDTCDEVIILRAGRLVHRQALADQEVLHIVRGAWQAAASETEFWSSAAPPAGLVFEQQLGPTRELHLRGDPRLWMEQVRNLPLQGMTVERAGVRAIYERFHHART